MWSGLKDEGNSEQGHGSDDLQPSASGHRLFNNDHLCGTIVENPTRFILDIKFEVELPQIIKCFIFWLGYRTWVCVRGWSHAPGMARIFSRF